VVSTGTDVRDGAFLRKRALEAIGAQPVQGQEELQALPAFELVKVHPPLVVDVTEGKVLQLVDDIKRRIRVTGPRKPGEHFSEVILLYFQSEEKITPRGHYLLTDRSQYDPDLDSTGVTCEQIIRRFANAEGAQVVMLDVQGQAANRAEADFLKVQTFDGTRVGLFHYRQHGSLGDPPGRFLDLLEDSWKQAKDLQSLATEVEKRLASQLQFSKYLPGELATLAVGRAGR
jgi:hypothetical protein